MKRIAKVVFGSVLISSLILNPYSINFEKLGINKNLNVSAETDTHSFVFVTKDKEIKKNLKNVINTKSLDELDEKVDVSVEDLSQISDLENNKKLNEAKDIAFNIKDVNKDENIKKYLNNSLKKGKRIFLYGDQLTNNDFKASIKLEKMTINDTLNGKPATVIFGDNQDYIKEKGYLKKVNTGNDKKNESTNIIGYTLDDSQELQYISNNITFYNEDGSQSDEIPEEIYFEELLFLQSEIEKKEEKANKLEEEYDNSTASILTTSKVKAKSTRVLDKYGYYGTARNNIEVLGRVDTDYELYKQNSDSSSIYDYFSVKPKTQLTEYGSGQSAAIWQDIDIPYDVDELKDWSPYGDKNGISFNIALVSPFNLDWKLEWKDSTFMDDLSSLGLDYARWDVRDGDLSGQVFNPGAGWASKGRQAVCTIRSKGTFHVQTYTYVADTGAINVRYSY